MNVKNDIQSATASTDNALQDCPILAAMVSQPIVVKPSSSLSDILTCLRQVHRDIDQLTKRIPSREHLPQLQQLRSQASHIIVGQATAGQTHSWVGYLTEQSVLGWLGKAERHETAADYMHPLPVKVLTTALPSPQQLLELFHTQSISLILILDRDHTPLGFITSDSLQTQLDAQTWLRRYRVEDAMLPVKQLPLEASVLEVVQHFTQHEDSYVVLIQLVSGVAIPTGVVTRKDLWKLSAHPQDWRQTTVASLVSAPLHKLTVGQPLGLAHQLLADHGIDYLAVVGSNGDLQGLLNRSSIVALLNPQHLYTTIQHLQTHLNITQNQQQQQQQQYQIQLDNLGARVQAALSKEEELKAFQSEFIAHASHEFRTPLAVIASSAGILRDFGDRLNADKKQIHLQRIQTYVNQTTQMLDQLLEVEHTLTSQMSCQLSPLDLPQWCKSFIEELQAATPERDIQCLTDIMPPASAVVALDENLLRQILCNVLSNAIKYSTKNSIIQLGLHIREDIVVFNIQDNGIGISETDQTFVFQPFYRSDNVSHLAGTGLGLTIAKNCATLHGGYIHLTSQLDQGTRVDVVIPNTR